MDDLALDDLILPDDLILDDAMLRSVNGMAYHRPSNGIEAKL